MSQQLDSLARIGLCLAVKHSYENKYTPTGDIATLLKELEEQCDYAMTLYAPVNRRGLARIDRKITAIKKQSPLENELSIITIIEFALAVIDDICLYAKDERKATAISIAATLLKLRREIAGSRYYPLSSVTAARCADMWSEIQI